MLECILSDNELEELIDRLSTSRRIVGPVRRGDRYFYERVEDTSTLRLDFPYCIHGPKAFLFPPRETLLTFERKNGRFATHVVDDDTPLALVGVHPCDVNAIRLLDHVFGNGHQDEHYLQRRARTFIVAIDCAKPCATGVFCRDMGANELADGFDVLCHPLPANNAGENARFGVVLGTDAGRALVLGSHVGTPPTAEDERAFARYLVDKKDAFPPAMANDVDTLPTLLEQSYDSLLWEATGQRCYSCGSCNLSCPTCYCFDVHDEVDMSLTTGRRQREWGSCQLPGFAKVAGGHDFRPTPAARLRHRVFRKAKWVMEREGLAGCVGCARCDRACTAKISTLGIYKQLAEERKP